jgi:hypothetical protein
MHFTQLLAGFTTIQKSKKYTKIGDKVKLAIFREEMSDLQKEMFRRHFEGGWRTIFPYGMLQMQR